MSVRLLRHKDTRYHAGSLLLHEDMSAISKTRKCAVLSMLVVKMNSCCRRVKSQARFGSEDEDGTTIMFDADSDDQADRFPYGC